MPRNIPKVIFNPQSRGYLKDGFDTVARLLEVTLGPSQGVALSSTELKPTPEPVQDAATLARRITALSDRGQDVGAMLLRSLVWRVHQRIGDGAATTSILAQAILEQASRSVAAGANPVLVQRGIHQAATQASARLKALATPVVNQEQLAGVAFTATREPELSFILSELFDLLGKHAHILVEDYVAPYLEREYINGGQWQAKMISPYLISSPTTGKAIAKDCHVILFNGTLTDSEDALSILRLLSEQENKSFLLVAQKTTGDALNTLVATFVQNKQAFQIVVVDLVRAGDKAFNDLQDLALLTGARLINPQTGDRLSSIKTTDLGFTPRAEANTETLFVAGGRSNPSELRAQINALHTYLSTLDFDDSQVAETQMRLGRLSGSSGILKIGAYSKQERQVLHQKAQQGIRALHAAWRTGVLPGGGTAFLHCIPPLEHIDSPTQDEQSGVRAVSFALKRPFDQLLKNAGITDPNSLAQQIINTPPGMVFSLHDMQLRPALETGVLDAAEVLRTSLEIAASGARLALSTDVILLKRNPRVSYEP
jgi:chaperonin GroEL